MITRKQLEKKKRSPLTPQTRYGRATNPKMEPKSTHSTTTIDTDAVPSLENYNNNNMDDLQIEV